MSISSASGNKVEGNTIRGNDGGRMTIFGNNNTVGGMTSGAGNQLYSNGGDGVIVALLSTGNSILTNQIYGNAGLGIELGDGLQGSFDTGVTPNDQDDPDTGPNHRQNFPVMTSAIRDSTTGITTISGTLDSNPSQTYTVQCFMTEEGGDSSGHGEGQELLHTIITATGANGDSPTFTCTSSAPAVGDKVSATATNTATPPSSP
jgi:hypothetical protein